MTKKDKLIKEIFFALQDFRGLLFLDGIIEDSIPNFKNTEDLIRDLTHEQAKAQVLGNGIVSKEIIKNILTKYGINESIWNKITNSVKSVFKF